MNTKPAQISQNIRFCKNSPPQDFIRWTLATVYFCQFVKPHRKWYLLFMNSKLPNQPKQPKLAQILYSVKKTLQDLITNTLTAVYFCQFVKPHRKRSFLFYEEINLRVVSFYRKRFIGSSLIMTGC